MVHKVNRGYKRMLNGEIYYKIYPDRNTSYPKPLKKYDAKRIASNARESGERNARVIKINGGYAVYERNR